jgi:hypothetical protein
VWSACHVFSSFASITEQNPVPDEARGKVRLMAQAWIDWGKQRGYVDEAH